MDSFIKLDVNDFLKLQNDIKQLIEMKKQIIDDDIIRYHKDNHEFFRDIGEDIECKLYELIEGDINDD